MARRSARLRNPPHPGTAANDLDYVADSENVESDEDLSLWSDDNPNSDSENDVEDSNSNSSSDEIDPAVADALKNLKGVICGYAKKREKARRVEKHNRKKSRHVQGKGKGKSFAGESSSSVPSSRCNNTYFGEIVHALDDRKKDIIRERGFGILLEYNGCSVPRSFVQWIADQVDVNCCDIVVGGKVIPFSDLAVHLFLGIPIGGEDILQHHNDSVKSKFLSEIKEGSLPLIKTFGDKLKGNSLSDDDIFRYFMVIALSTFLCPNSNVLSSPKYLGPLIDLSSVLDWDWSDLVFKWLFASISSYRKYNRNTIGGCIYFLAGYYLDFVNFGELRQLPSTLPRIHCWKGSMIKTYASYDRVSSVKFGKRPVKSVAETCYVEEYLPEDACSAFKNTLNKRCPFIREQHKERMLDLFFKHHARVGFKYPGSLVAKMVKLMYETRGLDQDAADGADSENSDARESALGDNNVDDNIQVPSPIHDGVKEHAGVAAGTINRGPIHDGAQGNAGVAAGPFNRGMEERSRVAVGAGDPTRSNEEVSKTEIISSNGGLHDVPATDVCGSHTEILPCTNSSVHESGGRNEKRKESAKSPSIDFVPPKNSPGAKKRSKSKETDSSPLIEVAGSKDAPSIGGSRERPAKRSTFESSGGDFVATRTRRQLSKTVGRSPLSRMEIDNDGLGSLSDNPVDVDQAPLLQGSIGANKRQKLKEKVGERLVLLLLPLFRMLQEMPYIQGTTLVSKKLNWTKMHALLRILMPVSNPCATNTPFFNSPSVPPMRLFEFEDDLGNYVQDPKLRRPVGALSSTGTSSDNVCHAGISVNVQVEMSFFFEFRNGPDNWVFINRMRSNPLGGVGNCINEPTISNEIDGAAGKENVETDCIRMESVPFTEYPSDNEDIPVESRIALKAGCSVFVGTPLSARNMGCIVSSDNSASLSNDVSWQSSSAKLAVHRPRRLPIPSKYKLSPYVNPQARVRVSRHELDVYETVLKMIESSEFLDVSLVNYGSVIVKLSAMASSLKPGGVVHYFVVNAMCRLLFLRNHPRNSRRHFFFSKVGDFLIGNHGRDDENEKELFDIAVKCFKGAHRVKPLTQSDYLFFPILFHGRWYVVVVYFCLRWCIVLDPSSLMFDGMESAFFKAVKDEFIDNLMTVWKEVVKIEYGFHDYRVFFGSVPQQCENFVHDSGVYAIKNLEEFQIHINMEAKYTEADISHLRIKILNDMIFNEFNYADDGQSKINEVNRNLHAVG